VKADITAIVSSCMLIVYFDALISIVDLKRVSGICNGSHDNITNNNNKLCMPVYGRTNG
jgi:hypothetical protein